MNIDQDKFYDLVKSGKNASAIMDTLGLKSKAQLRDSLQKLSHERKEYLEVRDMFSRDPLDRKLAETGLSIPRSLLEEFSVGDVFRLEVLDGKIVLTLQS